MLSTYRNKHRGETCLVIGNGPSLAETPLHELGEEYISFGANAIYSYPFHPTYLTMIDQSMIRACMPDMIDYKGTVFMPMEIPLPGRVGMHVMIGGKHPPFMDASKEVVMGGTVTYANLQLAYFMGFRTVLLVGVDHSYSKTINGGKPGSLFLADGKDPDHFQPKDGGSYFKKGFLFARPELAGTERNYGVAKIVFEKDSRKIINLTHTTALEVFEKGTPEDWLK